MWSMASIRKHAVVEVGSDDAGLDHHRVDPELRDLLAERVGRRVGRQCRAEVPLVQLAMDPPNRESKAQRRGWCSS